MKRTRLLLIVVTQLWLLLAPSASNAIPVVSVQPASVNPAVGDSFALSIAVSGAVDLYAFQFDLAFDPALVAAASVSEGAFLMSAGPTFFVPGTIDNLAGVITLTANSLTGPIAGANGDGVLVELAFDALVAGATSIVIQNLVLLDSTLADIAFTARNGSVVVGPVSVPEPAAWTLLLVGAALGRLRTKRRSTMHR